MKIKFNYIFSAIFLFALTSCNEDQVLEDWIADNPVAVPVTGDAGDLDLSNYVALGNSLTAGFTDGALYPEGQATSFASLLAGQFALAGGGSFEYPNISNGNGFGGVNGETIIGKAFIDVAAALEDPSNAIQFTAGNALTANTVTGLNNFGVPGARIVDAVTAGYGMFNPFYGNFQSSAGASMLGDAVAANPTFFTVWLGANDVLGFARNGGTETDGDQIEGNQENATNPALLTSEANFSASLTATLDAMTANGAKGVILNIPPVTTTPYFQIVTTLAGGVELIPITSQAQADQINGAYADYNNGLDAAVLLGEIDQDEADRRYIEFALGANAPVITDESLTEADISAAFMAPPGSVILPNIRQAEATDLFPLPALTIIGTEAEPGNPASVYGVGVAVPDQYTLTLAEQLAIINRYDAFNTLIADEAATRDNVELVDLGPMFADVLGINGTQAAGLKLSAAAQAAADGVLGIRVGGFDLVPLDLGDNLFNSIFSADGIHPNPRGAALVANEIIRTMNSEFGSEIVEVDPLAQIGISAVLP